MIRFILFTLFISSNLFGNLLKPEDGHELNYIHVLFEWEQEPDAVAYQIEISTDSNFSSIIVSQVDSSLIYIEKEMIGWGAIYYWRVCPIYIDETYGEWIGTQIFSTGQTVISNDANTIIINEDLIAEGLTILGAFQDFFSAVIDKYGNEIWNTGNEQIIFYRTDDYGQFLGCKYSPGQTNLYMGVEFSIDADIDWNDPNDTFGHHDLVKMPNGNYLSMVTETEQYYVPCDLPYEFIESCINSGVYSPICYCEIPAFPWMGDRIVEWDKATGEEVWSWSVFDHFSFEDYELENGTWFDAFYATPQRYDWTHANALWFDESESAIYVSFRHLSRISKIDYPSGNIIWSMGEDMPSGHVTFGHDLGFNFQHGVDISKDGTILTLDNGNSTSQTRAIEISVAENDGVFSSDIVWEHPLRESLFGQFSGNVQKLDNGNYLATTIGERGTSIEITPNHEEIWETHYWLSIPLGAVHRANRIKGLYPLAFSVVVDGLTVYDGENAVTLPAGSAVLNVNIFNEGSSQENFDYNFEDPIGWFENESGTLDIDSEQLQLLSFVGNTSLSSDVNQLTLTVTPAHRPDLTQIIEINVHTVQSQGVNSNNIISEFSLRDPYPNPFNSRTKIYFFLKQKNDVSISFYSLKGEELDNLDFQSLERGEHFVEWNAGNNPSGIYLLKLETMHQTEIKKLTFLR